MCTRALPTRLPCLQATRSTGGPSARPLVFALSNPTDQAEVSFQEAVAWTSGAAVYASGSPFPPLINSTGKTLRPAQANNCFVFPGLAQGVLDSGVRRVDDRLLLVAAETIAGGCLWVVPVQLLWAVRLGRSCTSSNYKC